MNKTLDEMKMIHEEEMQSYGRIQDRVISVMLSHGCKIVQTPSFEDYDSYGTYFPSLRKEMIKTIDSDGSVLVLRPVRVRDDGVPQLLWHDVAWQGFPAGRCRGAGGSYAGV